MTLANTTTVNHRQEDATPVSVTDCQKVMKAASAILSTQETEERKQPQKDYSAVDFGSILEDVSSLTLPLASTAGNQNRNNCDSINNGNGSSNIILAEREQDISSHLQAIMGYRPSSTRRHPTSPNITDSKKVLERLTVLNQIKKCDMDTSKRSLISTDARDKQEKKKTSLTTTSTHNSSKTSSTVSRDQSPRRHTTSVASKSISATSCSSVKEEAGKLPTQWTGDTAASGRTRRVTSTSKMRQSQANKDDEPQEQLKSRHFTSASERRHENERNKVAETKGNHDYSSPTSSAHDNSSHDTKKSTRSKRDKTGSSGRSSSARPSQRAKSLGPSHKKAQQQRQQQQPEGDALSKRDSNHSPRRNNPSNIRSFPPLWANNEAITQQAKTEKNAPFIHISNKKDAVQEKTEPKTSSGWMVGRKKYAMLDQEDVDDIPKARISEPISVATAAIAATRAVSDQARAASPRRATAPAIKESTIRAGPEKDSNISRRRREGSVANRRRQKKETMEDSSASASDSKRRVTLSSSAHHKQVDRNSQPGNDPEADIPLHSKRISKALDDRRGRRGRSFHAGGNNSAGGPSGRRRGRPVSVSLSPLRKANSPASALRTAVMRKQHSLRSFLDDLENGQHTPATRVSDEQVVTSSTTGTQLLASSNHTTGLGPERITASSLKERLRNLVSLDCKQTKDGGSGGDDDEASCSQSYAPTVVVPFVNEIPRDILKIQKQKAQNSPQFAYAGEFSDLIDDEYL